MWQTHVYKAWWLLTVAERVVEMACTVFNTLVLYVPTEDRIFHLHCRENLSLGPNAVSGYKMAKSCFVDCCVYIIAFQKLWQCSFHTHSSASIPNSPVCIAAAALYLHSFFEADNPADFPSVKENTQEVVAPIKEVVLSSFPVSHGYISRPEVLKAWLPWRNAYCTYLIAWLIRLVPGLWLFISIYSPRET